MIFFHGGGMTCGGRECPAGLFNGNYAIAEPRYRFSPQHPAPAQIEDAAQAIAYCIHHAASHNINPQKIFVGGMSAGAYLAAISVMAPKWLAPYGLNYKDIAGLILVSGQMTTHFNIKSDLGRDNGRYNPLIDEYAPLAHLAADLPPIIMITGESGLDIPVGMKNPTSGDFGVMLNSVYAAQQSHHFVHCGYEVETSGNPYAHVILRGAVSKHGNTVANYHYEDLIRLHEQYEKMDVVNPAAIIDTNHSNSGKKYKEQIRIAKEVLQSRKNSEDLHKLVKGLMIESYIEEGAQSIGDGVYGKSITDPCLGWEDSKRLIYDIAEKC